MEHVDGGPDSGPAESGERSQALLEELAVATSERARAEAREAELMVEVDTARTREAARHEDPRLQALEASTGTDDIGLIMGLPAGIVTGKLFELHLVRGELPGIWAMHTSGQIDSWRVHVIDEAAARILDPANLTLLDEQLTSWLRDTIRTPGQLRAKLRRMIARLEPEQRAHRYTHAWGQRRAHVSHDHDDGTALLFSTLSATDGIAVQDLIDQLARQRAQNTKGLTAEQACADVVADLLLGRIHIDGSGTGTSRVRARIGVMVPVTTLAGLDQAPGISVDRQTALDPETVRELAALPGTFFRRLLTDESDNLLEVTAGTYRTPKSLREAVAWRDGICGFPTCQRPASACDLDHIDPWPNGPTAASNLRYLCRRHHRLKTHGMIPTRDPTGT